MNIGFAEIDITPPVGVKKIGWLKNVVGERVSDPLFARAAVFESKNQRMAFIQLDTLSIRWAQVDDIRRRIARKCGFPGENIMVSATHNHSGPAVSNIGEVTRDEAYIETMVTKVVGMFGTALGNRQEAEIGFGRTLNCHLAHNRRVIMRDGTVRTHGRLSDPDALCIEGPIDPEVGVVAARAKNGRLLGILLNYACHPVHGAMDAFSAGYPGVLAREMKMHDCPVTLFLNGAMGNMATSDPRDGTDISMEEAGAMLAADARRALITMTYHDDIQLASRTRTIQLPFRRFTDEEIRGTLRGAQRFIDSSIYDRTLPKTISKIKARGHQLAEVQILRMEEHAFVSIPAELFVELGLKIKEGAHPARAWIVGMANGIVGYVPHREAFAHGGYETTFISSSKLAPEAGDMLVDCCLSLLHQRHPAP